MMLGIVGQSGWGDDARHAGFAPRSTRAHASLSPYMANFRRFHAWSWQAGALRRRRHASAKIAASFQTMPAMPRKERPPRHRGITTLDSSRKESLETSVRMADRLALHARQQTHHRQRLHLLHRARV